jgi:uncharacterized protein (DUF1800 family)
LLIVINKGTFMSLQASIATNRFGLGARPNELVEAKKDPKAWLIKQLQAAPAIRFNNNLPHSSDIANKLNEYRLAKKQNKKNAKADKPVNKKLEGRKYNRQVLQRLSADTCEDSVLTLTKRIDGRVAASAMASASM